jgi:hypothetical protein
MMARDGPETRAQGVKNNQTTVGEFPTVAPSKSSIEDFGNSAPETAPKKAPASRLESAPKAQSVTSHKRVKKPAGKAAKKPPKTSGFFWRKNGAGWDLRRDTYVTSHDGVKKRKQPYVAHMGREEFAEMKRKHKGAALEKAIAQWIAEHDR